MIGWEILSSMKTIFITCLTPFITRNILFSEAFATLGRQRDLRMIIFCPDFKREYFESNFASANVVIEPITPQASSRQDSIFKYLCGNLIDNRTRYIHQRRELLRDKNYLRFFASRIATKAGRWVVAKRLARALDFRTISGEKFSRYFDLYSPDLVFCPDVFHDDDVHCLAEARKRGVKTVGMIRSWDNITNKGLFRVKPDYLIANNEIIRSEAIEFEDMDSNRIIVVGMPQFDRFENYTPGSREEFFGGMNLNPKKKLIMFSPHGVRFHDTDWHIMQILKEAISAGELPADTQVLVRFPPIDDVPLGDFVPGSNFFIDKPARSFDGGLARDQELDNIAAKHLADSIYYSDVIITYNSSLIIDAAVFDKPAIGVAFDGWDEKPDIFRSVARFMEYDHTKHILDTGGLHVVRNRQELIYAVNKYLNDPLHNFDNRRQIIQTQCWKLDGRAGERIADFICVQIYKT